MLSRIRAAIAEAEKRPGTTILGLAALIASARLVALFSIGPLRHGLDFDEGAYFTTAALWVRGHAPYVDFAATHPPGAIYALAPFTLLGAPSTGLVLARSAMALLGGLNAWLIGSVARRFVPLWPACAGMVLCAAAPAAAMAERTVYLETMLNCACLLVVFVWTARLDEVSGRALDRRAWLTGVLFGVALAFKFFAIFLVVPLAATAVPGRRVRDVARVAVGACASWLAMAAPMLLRGPEAFLKAVVLFQADRHDGGDPTALDRLFRVFADPRHPISSRVWIETIVVLTAIGALGIRRWPNREVRFALAWLAAILVGLILAPLHWAHYNAHAAPALGLVAAWAVSEWWTHARSPNATIRRAGVVALVAIAAAGLQGNLRSASEALSSSDVPLETAALVKVQPKCTFSFEAIWLILGDRIPDPDLVGPAAADSYVAGLLAANESGRGDEGLASPAARRVMRDAVEACPTVLLGPRGRWQLGDQLAWFEREFHQVASTGHEGPDVWQRNP